MPRIGKSYRIAIYFIGAVLALILFAVPYEFCMDGKGYGFPFAWYHPGHGEWGAIVLDPYDKFSDVIDFPNLAISVTVWGVAFGALLWHDRRRRAGRVNTKS
jgi:hypothetical protein